MCIRDRGATQQVARVRLTVEREDASGGDAAQTLGRGGRVTRGEQPAGLTQLGLESTPVCGSTTRARPRALLGTLGHGNIIDGIARTYPPLRATGSCLLYTSDAADDLLCVDLGGR